MFLLFDYFSLIHMDEVTWASTQLALRYITIHKPTMGINVGLLNAFVSFATQMLDMNNPEPLPKTCNPVEKHVLDVLSGDLFVDTPHSIIDIAAEALGLEEAVRQRALMTLKTRGRALLPLLIFGAHAVASVSLVFSGVRNVPLATILDVPIQKLHEWVKLAECEGPNYSGPS